METQTIKQLREMAFERWGDVPVTIELRIWDDETWQATAFHTICLQSVTEPYDLPENVDYVRAELQSPPGSTDVYEAITTSRDGKTFKQQRTVVGSL